jgi:hypothetical protein
MATFFNLWPQLTLPRQGGWRTFFTKFMKTVQEITGDTFEIGDAGDGARIALIETLQGQIENLEAEVRLDLHSDNTTKVNDSRSVYNYEDISTS